MQPSKQNKTILNKYVYLDSVREEKKRKTEKAACLYIIDYDDDTTDYFCIYPYVWSSWKLPSYYLNNC